MADLLQRAIDAALDEATPAPLALVRLIMAAGSASELQSALASRVEIQRPGSREHRRASVLLQIWSSQPQAWDSVRSVLRVAVHDEAAAGEDPVARWTRIFDHAAAVSPHAAVALYSLGDERLLDLTTGEIVEWLNARGLVHDRQDIVDLGCGIGRIAQHLAPDVRSVTGVDVSQRLLTHAQTRCLGQSNLLLVRSSGRDLACLRDCCATLVLAVDVMPYIVSAGPDLVSRILEEAHRVLRPGGTLVVMNWSYRGGDTLDMAEADESARRAALRPVLIGETPFLYWDGRVYAFERPPWQSSCDYRSL